MKFDKNGCADVPGIPGLGLHDGVKRWKEAPEPGPEPVYEVGTPEVDIDGVARFVMTPGTTLVIKHNDRVVTRLDVYAALMFFWFGWAFASLFDSIT
jgi:hypothetical protein